MKTDANRLVFFSMKSSEYARWRKNEKENRLCPLRSPLRGEKTFRPFPYVQGTYDQHLLVVVVVVVVVVVAVVVVVVVAVAVAVVAVVAVAVVGRDNERFFADADGSMDSSSAESKMELVDDEYSFRKSVELVLFQHYFQRMLNPQIHNADASLTQATLSDAVRPRSVIT
jgi:hypothetical protein